MHEGIFWVHFQKWFLPSYDSNTTYLHQPRLWRIFDSFLQEYDSDEASPTSNFAEVERFQGKVVYNLDGKAYIIDSENELSLQLSDSSIIKGKLNPLRNG